MASIPGVRSETRATGCDGERVRFTVTGREGPTFLLLHGIPGSRGSFDAAVPHLSPRGRVVVPDLLGFGVSDLAPAGCHAAEQARSMLGVLDAIGADHAHLVGFDYGGPIALLISRLAPERVASLTLAATAIFPDTPIPGPLRLARLPVLGGLMLRTMFSSIGLDSLWKAAVGDKEAFPLGRLRRLRDFPAGLRSAQDVFLRSLRDLQSLYAPVLAAARELRAPAAVLWGDRDPFFSVTVGERTAAATRATLTVLPGCGHFIPEERPEALARAVLTLAEARR